MTEQIKPPPHNLDAERSVLGCCLLDKAARITVLSIVREDDFFQPQHRIIFQAIEYIASSNKIPDYVTVTNRLMETGNLEASGGAEYVAVLTNEIPSVRNAEHYSEIVKETSGKRQMIRLGNELSAHALNSGRLSCDDLTDKALTRLIQIGQSRSVDKAKSLQTTYLESMQYASEVLRGSRQGALDLGYPNLQGKLSLEPGELCVIGGWTSTGKTTLAVNFAKNVAYHGGQVLFLSLEMSRRMIDHKFSSVINGIPGQEFKYGKFYNNADRADDRARYEDNLNKMGHRVWIKHCPHATIESVRRIIKQEMLEHPQICLVVIDYLQLLKLETTRYVPITERMTIISQTVKMLAVECDIPIIALSQFSRVDKKNPNRVPVLSDFRESGSIEQDADFCVLLNLLEDQTDGAHYTSNIWQIELIIAKGRTEGTNVATMDLIRDIGQFVVSDC